jgi:hypothetical protein
MRLKIFFLSDGPETTFFAFQVSQYRRLETHPKEALHCATPLVQRP